MKEKLPIQTKNKMFSIHQTDEMVRLKLMLHTIHCTCTAHFGEKNILSEFRKGVKDE